MHFTTLKCCTYLYELPMTRIELQISIVGSDHCADNAKTFASSCYSMVSALDYLAWMNEKQTFVYDK